MLDKVQHQMLFYSMLRWIPMIRFNEILHFIEFRQPASFLINFERSDQYICDICVICVTKQIRAIRVRFIISPESLLFQFQSIVPTVGAKHQSLSGPLAQHAGRHHSTVGKYYCWSRPSHP